MLNSIWRWFEFLEHDTNGFIAREHKFAALAWAISIESIVVVLLISGVDPLSLRETWLVADPGNKLEIIAYTDQIRNLFGAVALVAGSLLGALTFGNALKRTKLLDAEAEASRDRLNAEIFSKAVELIGNKESTPSRLGGIYSLEALALSEIERDADGALVEQCFETLAAFIRVHSNYQRESVCSVIDGRPQLREDIEAAVIALARSYPIERRPDIKMAGGINLRGAILRGLRLPLNSNLRQFDLTSANLSDSVLRQCTFPGAVLDGANLSNAQLQYADLTGVSAIDANFNGALVGNAQIEGMVREQGASQLNV